MRPSYLSPTFAVSVRPTTWAIPRNRWAAIAEQEAKLGLQESSQPGRSNGKAGDRSSTASTSSGPGSTGGGQRNSGTDSNVDGGGVGGGDGHQQALPHSNHSSLTFGGQRRYSGGTIGIASMLGSLSTVPTGRSISDGSMDRRVSSVLGTQETPPEFTALGNNGAAWRRQSAMGAPQPGGGFGYPRWGAARANGPRGAGSGEEAVDENGGVEGGLAVAAGAGARWSIDVGAEGTETSKEEQREETKSEVAAEGSLAKAKASPDGRSPVRDAGEASVAEAPAVVLPEALPE